MDSPEAFHKIRPLLAGLVHEIRNPVQGILASADAVACHLQGNDTAEKLLDMIRGECIRVDHLLCDLMDLVRPVEIQDQPLQIKRMVEDSLRTLQQEVRDRDAKVVVEVADHLWVERMDGVSFQKAILAVFRNALESKKSNGTIRVEAERIGENLRLKVEDDGEGIRPEDQPRVLEPFFSTRPKQAGLGLSIADRIVRLHEGNLQIHSETGAGTRVILLIPR